MPAKINLINYRFGKLVVLEETSKRKNKSVVWKCQCDCGNIVEYSTKELRSDGLIQCPSCGKNRLPQTGLTVDIIGKKFNHLTVLEKTNKKAGGKTIYKCECDCAKHNFVFTTRTDLISGHTKSCGCILKKYSIGDIVNNKKILDYTYKNNRLYYVCQCLFCNRQYEVLVTGIDNAISCGCQRSIGEFNISQILQNNNIPFIKEYVFPGTNYRYDFAILDDMKNIIRLIEFDGEQHFIENVKNSGWNTIDRYKKILYNDKEKNKIAKQFNIPLVRIPYWERDNITLDMILGDQYLIQ